MKIKVMADYNCAPLWRDGSDPDPVGNLRPEDLSIGPALCADLWAWASDYDATLVPHDPIRSGFASDLAEQAFDERGRCLAKRVAAELGERAEVRFWRDR